MCTNIKFPNWTEVNWTRDHRVLSATHTFVHLWNETHPPLYPRVVAFTIARRKQYLKLGTAILWAEHTAAAVKFFCSVDLVEFSLPVLTSRPTVGKRLSWSGWLVTHWNGLPEKYGTQPNTNGACYRCPGFLPQVITDPIQISCVSNFQL